MLHHAADVHVRRDEEGAAAVRQPRRAQHADAVRITPAGKFVGLFLPGETKKARGSFVGGFFPTGFSVILNWSEELKARMPTQ